ncbi:DUF2007 domain-containing protein [bacterium]|nr:DUF2007 domain-containing protein [bacterium]
MEEITVFRTWDEPTADMAVGLLRAEGLNATKLADVPRSVYPFTMDGLGEIEIRVPENEADQALEIIAARFSEDPSSSLSESDEFPEE